MRCGRAAQAAGPSPPPPAAFPPFHQQGVCGLVLSKAAALVLTPESDGT